MIRLRSRGSASDDLVGATIAASFGPADIVDSARD